MAFAVFAVPSAQADQCLTIYAPNQAMFVAALQSQLLPGLTQRTDRRDRGGIVRCLVQHRAVALEGLRGVFELLAMEISHRATERHAIPST